MRRMSVMPDTTTGGSNTLSYVGVATRLGMVHEPLADGVRITRPAEYGRAVAVLLTALTLPYVVPAGLVGANLAPLVRRIWGGTRPAVFEVSGRSLSLRNVYCDNQVRDFDRPRDAVYEVKYVSHSGNLMIRARGHELIDFRPVKDPAALQWIAGVLREALGLGRE
jgi:hypothetical protein